MDASLEKSCLDEIGHTVLDSQQKISVRTISNNYGLNFREAVNILQQWIEKNSAKANLVKEYIVRGFDSKRGGAFITVVSGKKLQAIQSKFSKLSTILYAVEVEAESSRKIIVPEEQEFKVFNLTIQSDKRDVQVFTSSINQPTVAAAVKQEPKSKINSMFAGSSSKPKPDQASKAATVKEEKQSPTAATGKKDETKQISPQKSPSKGSPSKKKEAKKVVTGKASIASFFSNKPGTPKPTAAVKIEKESPKEDTVSKKDTKPLNGKHEDTPRWKRMISDDSEEDDIIPSTPQAQKAPAKKGGRKTQALKKGETGKPNPNKRSRILQVQDSSEDEDENNTRNLREPEERLIKFDLDESEDAEMKDQEVFVKQRSPEKPKENNTNGEPSRKRAKVKKLVTKNFMDDEGYMTTIKEYVMVSESEDEDGDAVNNNAVPEKEPAANGKGDKTDAKSTNKKPTKVTPPTPKTKQGSIMSFFSKK